MINFIKTVRLGAVDIGTKVPASVFCAIKFEDGRLSITGVEGPLSSGNCRGSCGQIVMHLKDAGRDAWADFAPGWDACKVSLFLIAWDRWHLNDMKAGSPAQEAWLEDNPVSAVYPESHYKKACSALAAAGLHPDADGYLYGSAWKREEVPAEVLDFLRNLPATDRKPAWV